jgi:hypothetical protein
MKNIGYGILAGCLVAPVSSVLHLLIHAAILSNLFAEGYFQTVASQFVAKLYIGATVGILISVISLLLYALPIFLLLRKFKLANKWMVLVFALAPWVVSDLIISQNYYHFIEFGLYSIISAFAFWYFAKRSVTIAI